MTKPVFNLALFLVLFLLTACGQVAEDTTSERQVKEPATYTLATLLEPVTKDFKMPHVTDVTGQLLIVQGNTDSESSYLGHGGRLYLASFDGTAPKLLAERVSEASVLVAHDDTMVGYAAVDGRRWYLYVMDLATQTPVQLLHLSNRFGFIEGWSPDMQWVMLRANDVLWISSLDGATQYRFDESLVFWLSDSRALVIEYAKNWQDETKPIPVMESYIFDPLSGNRTDYRAIEKPMELTALVSNETDNLHLAETLSGGSGVFGAPLPMSENTLYNIYTTGQKFCADFIVRELTKPTLLYSATATFALSDYVETPDQSLYFQRWYLEDCILQPENLRSEVVRITPDNTIEILAEDIYPGISTNYLRASTGRKYTISDNGRYMVWISGSWDSLSTTIRIMDLQDGTVGNLMRWTSTEANSFLIWEAYNAVFWLD